MSDGISDARREEKARREILNALMMLLELEKLRRVDDTWDDRPLPEDAFIADAHPTRTGRDDIYAEAMRLVGAKRSKGALVELVNWLLARIEVMDKLIDALPKCSCGQPATQTVEGTMGYPPQNVRWYWCDEHVIQVMRSGVVDLPYASALRVLLDTRKRT